MRVELQVESKCVMSVCATQYMVLSGWISGQLPVGSLFDGAWLPLGWKLSPLPGNGASCAVSLGKWGHSCCAGWVTLP